MKWTLAGMALWAGAAMAQTAPSVQVTGMVSHAGAVWLAGLKQVTVHARFNSMHGVQDHRWTGPLLLDVVGAASVTDEPGKKTYWRHVIMAKGRDGYAVSVSIGEIDPKAEGKQVIVALREDDKSLAAPRLLVPGDTDFVRGVQKLETLQVR